MLGEEKNLKDSITPSPLPGEGGGEVNSQKGGVLYPKTHKLITALYMVTDIIDKDEPLRNKLRTLGTEIISDMRSLEQSRAGQMASLIVGKVGDIVSFLDIAGTMNIVSGMNSDILRKEFFKLKQSITDSIPKVEILNKKIDIAELFNSPLEEYPGLGQGEVDIHPVSQASHPSKRGMVSKGHHSSLGVQKAGTLMKAIKGISGAHNFDLLKKQRREDILNIIKILGGNATIKDIKDKVHTLPGQVGSLDSHSEKTLQRELVSMVSDGVLKKEGSKRWSKYFIK
ncbi:hypothetical protein A2121_01325 [Candidatus Nomurabacteria bacterium GWB1_40_6]|uniref:Uncharacterized protein n=1 Tax=Candidatus Nomurabacteria bacterium GWB1_40_6 TaxID=1801727 RepID=A0A1F6TLW9_9BACT|nr:MAG: hypothetical protein A2121_01325 [Candidatus Nomurabacteria bacterium GWB1_40_6]